MRHVLTVRRRAAIAAVLVASAVACAAPAADTAKDGDVALQASVDSAANRLLAALRSDAPDSLLALMPDDVSIMPPNEPALVGKPAVRSWYEAFVKQMRTSSLTITNRELLIGGRYATEVASFEWTLVPRAGGAPITDRGTYMQVWRREPSGQWVFSREVWNSSIAPGQ
jgi:ketosteroid isomerase-like protein